MILFPALQNKAVSTMMYANKKINQKASLAQQTAKIIANVSALEQKNLIRLTLDTVYLYPEIWTDKLTALNWINCLHHYYIIKRQFKSTDPLYFKNMETEEPMGSILNKKAKVLTFG